MQHWNIESNKLSIKKMPFYWRLSDRYEKNLKIPQHLEFRATKHCELDFLEFVLSKNEWDVLDRAYKENETIGFLYPSSGQLATYGKSVNDFFLNLAKSTNPKKIHEIGCGSGYTIQFLKKYGFDVIGIDPSEYSYKWSEKIKFKLINKFFNEINQKLNSDLIICNDVFEHVPNVIEFSKHVFSSLKQGGVFAFSTTNSTQSIQIGDISLFEHQHVNMFTEKSIYQILEEAGFNEISIGYGSYGNTFQVIAKKNRTKNIYSKNYKLNISNEFFEKADKKISNFFSFYKNSENLEFYVPLRSIPYLSTIGVYGKNNIFDSNPSWEGKYIDGYESKIKSINDIKKFKESNFFISSLTFFKDIKKILLLNGIENSNIYSIHDLA